MIIREIKIFPTDVIATFDFFNDYKDTRSWATSACPEVLPALDAAHTAWLQARHEEWHRQTQARLEAS